MSDRDSVNLRAMIVRAAEESRLARGAVLRVLDQSRHYSEARTEVETAVAVAGCRAAGFLWNKALAIYCDVSKGGREVAFLSKGWDDPGYRLGQMLTIPRAPVARFHGRHESLQRLLLTNGITCNIKPTADGLEVVLEYLLYAAGFNGKTLSQSLTTSMECSEAATWSEPTSPPG